MAEYKADLDLLTGNDSGPRNVANLKWIIFHTTENSGNTTAKDVATYQLSPSAGGSYNVLTDKFGSSVRSNSDNYVPWAAGSNAANIGGLHISIVAQAAQSREVWLRDYDKALRKSAEVVAKWSKDYGIPLVRRSSADLKAGVKGIAGHNECSQAFGGSDHWDPGTGFPYDVVIGYANNILNGGNATNPGGPLMALNDAEQRELLDGVRFIKRQLEPWPQLGKNAKGQDLTLVDAVAAVKAGK